MRDRELRALVNGLIGHCQICGVLPTDLDRLVNELQEIAHMGELPGMYESELHIPKDELVEFLQRETEMKPEKPETSLDELLN